MNEMTRYPMGTPLSPFFGRRAETLTPEQRLERENAVLREQVQGHEQRFNELRDQPMAIARLVGIGPKKSRILAGTNTIEIRTPSNVCDETGKPTELVLGCAVHVHPETRAIVDVALEPPAFGLTRKVIAIEDAHHALVEFHPLGERLVICETPPEKDDRVILDMTDTVIIRNLGKVKPPPVAIIETGVSWDDIGGLEDVKARLREVIESPFLDKELHAEFGQKRCKGVLLCGPPGCGKTMLAKAASTAIATLHGKQTTASGFIYVKGPELLSMWQGNSEGSVRELFTRARQHSVEHGYPALIFLDEADALLATRGRRGPNEGAERTIVPQFLAEMDGLDDSGALVMVATNRPETLDPAITREGRLDVKITVRRPTQTELVDVFARHFDGKLLADMTPAEACVFATQELLHERHALYMIRSKSGKDKRFTLAQLVSGSLAEAVVTEANKLAIRRAKSNKGKAEFSKGILREDIAHAANILCDAQRPLDHSQVLGEFLEPIKEDVREVTRVRS